MATDENQWWYNLKTGVVERGRLSPSVDRAGPFATEEEAASAPQTIAENARAWNEEEPGEEG